MDLKQASHSPLAGQPHFALRDGGEMPAIGFGTRGLIGPEAEIGVYEALTLGYRLIDTAPEYGSEQRIGTALALSEVPSEQVFVSTRVAAGSNPYMTILRQLEAIGVERLDLCLLQRPLGELSPAPYWEGMIEAQLDGLVEAIGVSGYSMRQIDLLVAASGVAPAVSQIEWSPFGHSPVVLEHAARNGIVIQAHSPLTQGRRLDNPLIAQLAQAHHRSPAEIMLRWALQVGVAAVVKAACAEHRRENLGVFDFELSGEEMHRMASLNRGYSSLGGLPYL